MFFSSCYLPDFSVLGLPGQVESPDVKSEDSGDSSSDETEEYSSSNETTDSDGSNTERYYGNLYSRARPPEQLNPLPQTVREQKQPGNGGKVSSNLNVCQIFSNIPNLPAEGLFGVSEDVDSETGLNFSASWTPCSFINMPNFTKLNPDDTCFESRCNKSVNMHKVSVNEQYMPKLDAVTERFEGLCTYDSSEMENKMQK